MPASVLSAFFVFTFITAITPGPNNILALTTGGRAGFRGSIPVLAGICGGFFCVMAICGVLSFSFSVLSASFLQIMRYVGSAYLLWLAWKTAMPKAGGNSVGRADAGFMTGFVLQFVNVKIMVYGMTAFHAVNGGSNPPGDAKNFNRLQQLSFWVTKIGLQFFLRRPSLEEFLF